MTDANPTTTAPAEDDLNALVAESRGVRSADVRVLKGRHLMYLADFYGSNAPEEVKIQIGKLLELVLKPLYVKGHADSRELLDIETLEHLLTQIVGMTIPTSAKPAPVAYAAAPPAGAIPTPGSTTANSAVLLRALLELAQAFEMEELPFLQVVGSLLREVASATPESPAALMALLARIKAHEVELLSDGTLQAEDDLRSIERELNAVKAARDTWDKNWGDFQNAAMAIRDTRQRSSRIAAALAVLRGDPNPALEDLRQQVRDRTTERSTAIAERDAAEGIVNALNGKFRAMRLGGKPGEIIVDTSDLTAAQKAKLGITS